MASLRLAKEERTTVSTFCRRSTSCCRQMLSGFGPPCERIATFTSSPLKSAGSFVISSSTCANTSSSRVAPPPPPPSFGWMSSTVPSTSAVCAVRKTRSAFEWSPKSPGSSISGSPSTNFL